MAPPTTTTQTSGCDWSPRRARARRWPSCRPASSAHIITKFAGAEELRLIRLLSKRHRRDVAVDRHWQVLCGTLWTDKPGFAGRRKPLWGVFAASGELTVADRALQSSSETQASFVRVSLSEPRTHDLAPHETCRRLNWRESYDGSVKDATRTEITAQEFERWPWLCMDYMGFRGHALAFEGRGLRHGERRPLPRKTRVRAARADASGAGVTHASRAATVARRERGAARRAPRRTGAGGLRHMMWAWDAAPGAALAAAGGLAAGRAAGGGVLSWAWPSATSRVSRPRRPAGRFCRGFSFRCCHCAFSDRPVSLGRVRKRRSNPHDHKLSWHWHG